MNAVTIGFTNEATMTPRRQIISGVLLAAIADGNAVYLALVWKEEMQLAEGFCAGVGRERIKG